MAGLVAQAQATRDGGFNHLDAVNRATQRATDRLARQVDHYVRVHESALAELDRIERTEPPADERRVDRRFADDDE